MRVGSVGLRAVDADPFAAAVMDESVSTCRSLAAGFDAIGYETSISGVSLSTEAPPGLSSRAHGRRRRILADRSRRRRLARAYLSAYRDVRDTLLKDPRAFGSLAAPVF